MYATAASIERLKPPGRRAFLPWLLMLTPDVRHLFGGGTPLPWLATLGLAAFMGCYVAAVFTGLDPRRRATRTPLLALGGLAAVTLALGIGYAGNWLLCFPLLSLATGIVLRGRRHLGPVILSFAGSAAIIASVRGGASDSLTVGYGTVLSGLVTAAILSLFETVAQLRATRQELARTAVEKERLRFSRDLHDLLGHTMSVVVVKAEAVRRLAPRDLDAALGQDRVPLLAAWGAGDEIFGPDGARAFARDLPDAEIHLVPGGGHFLLESHLDTVAGYIRGFLTS